MEKDAPHRPGERIYQGAEATLTARLFLGRLVVVKHRKPKGYRLPALEATIARGRMRNEARLMRRARAAGVAVPAVLDADPEEQSLALEYLGRHSLRTQYEGLPRADRLRAARSMGGAVGRLHAASIIHGDLTTSNMMRKGGRVHLIDFSLGHVSDKTEDRAVDLKAFKDSFVATHLAHATDLSVVFDGYAKSLGPAGQKVIKQIASIERRRRYA